MDYGDPILPERYWEKVFPEPMTGHWLWGAAYAVRRGRVWGCQYSHEGRVRFVHHLLGEMVFGVKDNKLIKRCSVMDVCVNDACMRVLDVVRCPQGHPKLPETIDKYYNCRECKKIHASRRDRSGNYVRRGYGPNRGQFGAIERQKLEAERKSAGLTVFGDKPPAEIWRPGSWKR